ncbi:MAG TPA: hypothetical protein VJ777_19250 [Mycobacterium sp.]|nr:hypothetical protein [Mycobacterium sp.]
MLTALLRDRVTLSIAAGILQRYGLDDGGVQEAIRRHSEQIEQLQQQERENP